MRHKLALFAILCYWPYHVEAAPHRHASPVTAAPPPAACSHSVDAIADGCQNAPCLGIISAQNPTGLNTYGANRPARSVAGVDYPVGECTTLTSVLTATLPGCASLDTTNHLVRIEGNNCTLSGLEFNPSGISYGVLVDGCFTGTIVKQSHFKASSSQVLSSSCGSGGTFTTNTVDGSQNDCAGNCDNLIQLTGSTTTPWTITYNYFFHVPSHNVIDTSADIIKYNYSADAMWYAGAHADDWHIAAFPGSGVYNGPDIEYNAHSQGPATAGFPGSHNSGICFCSGADFGSTGTWNNVVISNNTYWGDHLANHQNASAPTSNAYNYLLYITCTGGCTAPNPTVKNNFVDMLATGNTRMSYPDQTGISGLVWSGNTDLSTDNNVPN